MFSLAYALPSPTSAAGLPPLFDWFKKHLTMSPARLEVKMDSLLPFL